MKRTEKEFNQYVKELSRMVPAYSYGRRVVVLSENTKRGQAIIESASRYEGTELHDVYERWSLAKQQAYDEAWQMYCNSRHGSAFGICSHNCMMFTVSWVSDDGIHFLTSSTEYLVILNE